MDSLQQFGDGAEDIYRILALNTLAMFAEDYEYIKKKDISKNIQTFNALPISHINKDLKEFFVIKTNRIKQPEKYLAVMLYHLYTKDFPSHPFAQL